MSQLKVPLHCLVEESHHQPMRVALRWQEPEDQEEARGTSRDVTYASHDAEDNCTEVDFAPVHHTEKMEMAENVNKA